MVEAVTQNIEIESHANIKLDVRREDLIHSEISGNKYRKLKYNLEEAKKKGHNSLLTFGGAYSNHIVATAYAGHINGFKTIGLIRGEELGLKVIENPTLQQAKSLGMKLVFVSRARYRQKESQEFLLELKEGFEDPYIIPEGGTNIFAIRGCEEIIQIEDDDYDFICTSVGTGGTLAGIIRASKSYQQVIGFSSLKGQGLKEDISKFVNSSNWSINFNYHFGGYAKINDELIAFINGFKANYGIPLDPVYTGKMMFGIMDMIKSNLFPDGAKILAIHTGGLQGIKGMNKRLKRLNKPQINV